MRDLTDQKFNRWYVIRKDSHNKSYYICRCDCGTVRSIRSDGLKSGASKSCGCLKSEKWIERNTKYKNGENVDTPFYRRWEEMRGRCQRYQRYLKKGIQVCDRWLDPQDGFKNFHADMYEEYVRHVEEHGLNETTLDRIDNDGDYEPSNCRWATRAEQVRNSDRCKPFIAIHETGVQKRARVALDFAEEHKLSSEMILRCLHGQQETHRGWRFKYA